MGIFAIGVVAAAAGVAYAASRKPDTFRISRSALLKAPVNHVFAQVNDYHRWTNWSPWEKLDPNLQRTYSGPEAGVGANYEWSSNNNKAGAGKMAIDESIPNQRIGMSLEFLRPMAAKNRAEFDFEAKEGGTQVTWTMTGTNGYMNKLMSLVMDLDKIVGPQFEEGLANLERAANGSAGDKQLGSEA